jgi:hypothetical protein
MQRALEAVENMAVEMELAADMRKAEAHCVRQGWLGGYQGDGILETTEAGEHKLSEYLAASETCH